MTFEPLTPERRREMTRQHLLDAAAIVFARAGFHAATLDEIAATAGFTKGAVYSNFKSKDDLFLALVADRAERQFALVDEVLETSPHEAGELLPRISQLLRTPTFVWDDALEPLYLEFVLYARRNPEARAKLAASMERWRALVQELVEHDHAIQGGSARYPTGHLAEIAMAVFDGLAIHRLLDPSSVSEEILETTLSVLYGVMAVDDEESASS
ncbi:MAG TPA: TetR/AcrR family transcriptional regulator [Acidimicrobiales bacterium]|nr:TetR/AcrR family transcriptional regulator [Acidimicrobiales bacterium]